MGLKINPQTGTIQNQDGGGITLEPGNNELVTIANGVMFPDGTASEPGIRFDDDTNTGIYSPVNDSVGIVGHGCDIARFKGVINAVNYVEIIPNVTGAPVSLKAEGSDPNINLSLTGKGSGDVTINNIVFPLNDGAANAVIKTDGNGNLFFDGLDYNDLANQPNIPTNLSGLSDANITTPQTNQILKYNGSTFANGSVDYAEISNTPNIPTNLSGLTDVDTASGDQGWSLKYLNDTWVPRPDWTIESNIGGPNLPQLIYGIVGCQGAGAVGRVQNVTVNFDIVTNGTIQFGSAVANAEDMAIAINRDLNAQGETRVVAYHKNNLLYLVNSDGGGINLQNITNDSSGNPVFGDGSCSGLPLTIDGGSKGSIKVNHSGLYRDLAVGTNGQVLTADSTTTSGLAWSALSYNDLSDVPATFTPSAHTHVLADITDFNAGAFATSAQGDLADSALQPGSPLGLLGNVDLTNNAVDKILQFNGTNFVPIDLPSGGGASTFTGLTDTPADFTGQANKVLAVNVGETALEFIDAAGGGGSDNSLYPADTWVKESTPTVGTGTVTLGGAEVGYKSFADYTQKGDKVEYFIQDGLDYELGNGIATIKSTPPPARYWRLFLRHTDGANYFSIEEIEFRATPGGTDLTNTIGGTAAAHSTYSGYNASKAFDEGVGNDSRWFSNQNTLQEGWIRWDFGAGNDQSVLEFTVRWNTSTNAPDEIELQYSDDGVTWNDSGFGVINAQEGGYVQTPPAYTLDTSSTISRDTVLESTNSNNLLSLTGSATISSYVRPGAITNISELNGVSISSPVADEVLSWNGSAWVNQIVEPTLNWAKYSGTVTIAQTATGVDSLAIGENVLLGSANNVIAIGKDITLPITQISNDNQILVGNNITMNNVSGTAKGGSIVLSPDGSEHTGLTSIEGRNCVALYTTRETLTLNNNTVVMGQFEKTKTIGTGSVYLTPKHNHTYVGPHQDVVAIGRQANPLSSFVVAIGYNSRSGTSSQNSVAIGRDSNAAGQHCIAIGPYANSGSGTTCGIGIGRNALAPNDGLQIKVNDASTLNMQPTAELSLDGTNAQYVVPSYTTTGRPVGTTGGMVFDTDLGKPIWYNGTDWVDATGTTV